MLDVFPEKILLIITKQCVNGNTADTPCKIVGNADTGILHPDKISIGESQILN